MERERERGGRGLHEYPFDLDDQNIISEWKDALKVKPGKFTRTK